MVNFLLVSHSKKLVEGLREILYQMSDNIKIEISGLDSYGNLGTNFQDIYNKINRLTEKDGLIILYDLGSSRFNCKLAIDMLDNSKKKRVILADTPMIESSAQLVINASIGIDLEQLQKSINKIIEKQAKSLV